LLTRCTHLFFQCYELLAVTMGMYLMDPKCRQAFANESTARVVLQIMDSKYSVRTAFVFLAS
jgi:hypothetical protein